MMTTSITKVKLYAILLCSQCFCSFGLKFKFRTKYDYMNMSNLSKYDLHRGDLKWIQFKGETCKPISMWLLMRHGVRYPTEVDLPQLQNLEDVRDAIIENHRHFRGSLPIEDLIKLRHWRYDSEILPFNLAIAGYNETIRIAHRLRNKFPSLLRRRYTPDNYYFQHSSTQRTAKTADAFVEGIFGGTRSNVDVHVVPATDDILLLPFDGACPNLIPADVEKTFLEYISQYTQTKEFQMALKQLSSRLGFDHTLPPEVLLSIFNACGYESAWFQESIPYAPWCAALDERSLKVGEYFLDLLMYSISGYGSEAKERVGCGLVKDLFFNFNSAVHHSKSNKVGKVTVYFAHDAVILLMHTALGLLRDDPPLTPLNFEKQANRQFRPSKITPFSSSVAAVLYRCKSQKPHRAVSHRVTLLRNERAWTGIPKCPKGVCSWESFKELMWPQATSCDYEDFCFSPPE